MKILENTIKLEDDADIALLTELVMSDEDFDESGSFVKDGKKYYTQTYCIDYSGFDYAEDEVSFVVFVNWEDDSETCEIDFYIGQEFLIR